MTVKTGNSNVDAAYKTATIKHGGVSYPTLNLDVHIVGNCFLSGAIGLFAMAGCRKAESLKEADLVVFLGGADIDPQLYGEKSLGCTSFSPACDTRDVDAYAEALHYGIPMFGICRGQQFLHAMAGGKLYQDVQNHTSSHNIVDVETGAVIKASSMHHQMVIENDDMQVLAYAENPGHGRDYIAYTKHSTDPTHRDVEAAIYPSISAIAVQGHPEVGGYAEYSAWCLSRIGEFLDELKKLRPTERESYVLGPKGRADRIDPSSIPASIMVPKTEDVC